MGGCSCLIGEYAPQGAELPLQGRAYWLKCKVRPAPRRTFSVNPGVRGRAGGAVCGPGGRGGRGWRAPAQRSRPRRRRRGGKEEAAPAGARPPRAHRSPPPRPLPVRQRPSASAVDVAASRSTCQRGGAGHGVRGRPLGVRAVLPGRGGLGGKLGRRCGRAGGWHLRPLPRWSPAPQNHAVFGRIKPGKARSHLWGAVRALTLHKLCAGAARRAVRCKRC